MKKNKKEKERRKQERKTRVGEKQQLPIFWAKKSIPIFGMSSGTNPCPRLTAIGLISYASYVYCICLLLSLSLNKQCFGQWYYWLTCLGYAASLMSAKQVQIGSQSMTTEKDRTKNEKKRSKRKKKPK